MAPPTIKHPQNAPYKLIGRTQYRMYPTHNAVNMPYYVLSARTEGHTNPGYTTFPWSRPSGAENTFFATSQQPQLRAYRSYKDVWLHPDSDCPDANIVSSNGMRLCAYEGNYKVKDGCCVKEVAQKTPEQIQREADTAENISKNQKNACGPKKFTAQQLREAGKPNADSSLRWYYNCRTGKPTRAHFTVTVKGLDGLGEVSKADQPFVKQMRNKLFAREVLLAGALVVGALAVWRSR